MESEFARLTYPVQWTRYFIEGVVRRDGSSKFDTANKLWGIPIQDPSALENKQ